MTTEEVNSLAYRPLKSGKQFDKHFSASGCEKSFLGYGGALLKQMEDYYQIFNIPDGIKGLNLFQLNDTGTAFEKIQLNQNNEAEPNPSN